MELFTSLTQNFSKIEKEIVEIKEKQSTKQIQELLENYEQKNEEEQRKLQESLQKPAQMLEDLKYKWSEMFNQQNSSMKDMIQTSVNDLLHKRKDERKIRKTLPRSNDEMNSDGGGGGSGTKQDQRYQFYKEKIDEF